MEILIITVMDGFLQFCSSLKRYLSKGLFLGLGSLADLIGRRQNAGFTGTLGTKLYRAGDLPGGPVVKTP